MSSDTLIFPFPSPPSLPVRGTAQRFAVGRIFCIGRNYADHAREMGHDPDREPPFFFLKPATALSDDGHFIMPVTSSDVHHEVELVAALGKGGRNIEIGRALEHVFGYCVGLDMTQRDIQAEAKRLGRPWDAAKGFDGSAPCGEIAPAREVGHLSKGEISLSVNGQLRQAANVNQMIWSLPEIIAALSRSFALAVGDLIMTGTPAGVGAVKVGDQIQAQVEGLPPLNVTVRKPESTVQVT